MKTPIISITTPPRPWISVLEAMLPYFTQKFGNAASRNHAFGWESEKAVDRARKQIADVIGANPKRSCSQRRHRVGQPGDQGRGRDVRRKGQSHHRAGHRAQGDSGHLQEARETWFSRHLSAVKADGLVDLDQLRDSITDKTILVTVMYANNEIGVIQPISEIGKICHERGVLFHTDGVQAFGKVPVNVIKDNIDMMSITAHKIYGPRASARCTCGGAIRACS